MADLNNLSTLIEQAEFSVVDFGAKVYPHMDSETFEGKHKIRNQVNQMKKAKGIKFETLERIASITGLDYNEILNYYATRK